MLGLFRNNKADNRQTTAGKAIHPFTTIIAYVLKLYLIVGFAMRIVLMFFLPDGASMSLWEIVRSLVVGAVNDLCMGVLLCVPLWLIYLGHNEWKYSKRAGGIILGVLVLAFAYTFYPKSILQEYGGYVPLISHLLVGYKLLSFALRYFFPKLRKGWRRATIYVAWFLYVYILLFNAAGEWFFWEEFCVRYNFIAVDYLVYTYEVVGNIMESYAIVPLMISVAVVTAALIWWRMRRYRLKVEGLYTLPVFVRQTGIGLGACVASLLFLSYVSPCLEGENLSATQIQQNGPWDFVQAFRTNKLDYDQFYTMLPEAECRQMYSELCGGDDRLTTDSIAPQWQALLSIPAEPVNVVLITVESLSASFFTAYGNTQHITPCLDTLMERSMVLDSLYAVGNRTVRGLEALSLCLPPSAGESIIKRADYVREGQTVGHLLSRRGYQVQFLYGGDSYFDNMGDYFGKNGYTVIDRSQIAERDVTFANIWGVCDEDLYRKALSVFDANERQGKPFFSQLMTVSNHRPYTFPEGRITYEGDLQSREGAVKYTDYAIGQFLKEAASHKWFANTIFVVIADHCAASAGKVSIPIDKYHVPCIIYAPGMIEPCRVGKVCSQVDIISTLLAMLHIQEPNTFTGRNILADTFCPRAFMATYQDLGYMENGILTVLSPTRKVKQFAVRRQADGTHIEEPVQQVDETYVSRAAAYYQFANLYQK